MRDSDAPPVVLNLTKQGIAAPMKDSANPAALVMVVENRVFPKESFSA